MAFAASLLALIQRSYPFFEYVAEFCQLAKEVPLDDVGNIHLFRLGANYHHPMELPDHHGTVLERGYLRCPGPSRN